MRVTVKNNNNIEGALRLFKRKTSEILYEVRERQYYEKPTAKRNRKRKAAIIRERKRQDANQ